MIDYKDKPPVRDHPKCEVWKVAYKIRIVGCHFSEKFWHIFFLRFVLWGFDWEKVGVLDEWSLNGIVPAPKVWVLVAHLVEHCSTNTEAMCSNLVEALHFFLKFNLIETPSQLWQAIFSLTSFYHYDQHPSGFLPQRAATHLSGIINLGLGRRDVTGRTDTSSWSYVIIRHGYYPAERRLIRMVDQNGGKFRRL